LTELGRLAGQLQTQAPLVRLSGVSKSFGAAQVIEPLDLEIRHGDFFALLGPSGCGKTTLLRMIGGFLPPTRGRIEIGGRDVTHLGPEKRKSNMVFQGYGLFPHMTVRQNVAYGLRLAKVAKDDVAAKVKAMLELVHLDGFGGRFPKELSGGQQQRVALARALVMEPDVLLLDEPLAALDLTLRKAMQEELRQIHKTIGGTFVFVTHDQSEAMNLANRVAVMRAGRIMQEGSPEHIYRAPENAFVARFIGEANLFPAHRAAGQVQLFPNLPIASPGADGPVLAVIRPDALSLHAPASAPPSAQPGRITDQIFLGSYVRYTIALAAGGELFVHLPPALREGEAPATGTHIAVAIPPDAVWITRPEP
jgi:ABC-type Fe3+/spermidine/putrescine transport system ATPase subunit